MPQLGRDSELRLATISLAKLMVSPASTGFSQRSSRKPGEGPHPATVSPRDAAEQRVAALLLAHVKTLRIELPGEGLDGLGGEGEGADLAPLPDLNVLEKPHQRAPSALARRPTMIGEVISHSAWPAALRAVLLNVTMPVSGRLFEMRASTTSTSSVKSSPGRMGASQRTSLTPGEPREAVRVMKPSHSIRIMSEQRCQPEPDSPFSMDWRAASSSRCIGCGSNSLAKARISSRLTWCGPKLPKRPIGKSSKVSVVIQYCCSL